MDRRKVAWTRRALHFWHSSTISFATLWIYLTSFSYLCWFAICLWCCFSTLFRILDCIAFWLPKCRENLSALQYLAWTGTISSPFWCPFLWSWAVWSQNQGMKRSPFYTKLWGESRTASLKRGWGLRSLKTWYASISNFPNPQIRTFVQQTRHRSPVITCGMFKFDLTLFYSVKNLNFEQIKFDPFLNYRFVEPFSPIWSFWYSSKTSHKAKTEICTINS